MIGDFPMGPSFEIVEKHDLTAVFGQNPERGEQAGPEVAPFRILRRGRPDVRRDNRLERDMPVLIPVAYEVPVPVPDDLAEPGAKTGRVPAIVDPRQRIDERVLTDVFRSRNLPDDGQGDGSAAAQVPLGQSPRSRPASPSHLFDQLRIGWIHRLPS